MSHFRQLVIGVLAVLIGTQHALADRVVLVAGGGTATGAASALEARLKTPFGVDCDATGHLYFVELTGQRVCRIDLQGQLKVIAGDWKKGYAGDGGPATKAQFDGLHNLSISPQGDIYLADTWNQVVRKIDPKTGLISTIAGTGEKGFSGDGGPAVSAKFGGIYCVAVSPNGEQLYLADLDNRRIRVVDLPSGSVETVAGNGKGGVPMNNTPARDQPLVDPRAVMADKEGRVYVLERGGHALRVVDEKGQITTIVGTGNKGRSGDGGPAIEATLSGPKHLCMDRDGTVLIADTDNHTIRRYDPQTGQIDRVAGTGKVGTKGIGGPPTEVELNQPHGIFLHPSGDLYISDSHNHRILKIVRE
jgi:sugar lactone lactonase YvrE